LTDGQTLAERLSLIVITDPSARAGIVAAVRDALRAGAPSIQLRSKKAPTRQLLDLAHELRALTREANALLFINDRVDVALAAAADGAHLGDDDIPLSVARRIVPEGFLLGRSVDTGEEARQAEAEGADYVGLGPVYATGTKGDSGPVVGIAGVAVVRSQVRIPLVAIGGITAETAAEVVQAGADGIAVVSAVMRAADPEQATAELLLRIRQAKKS
jgi:thiamine-phosphate pyrophosphorylase